MSAPATMPRETIPRERPILFSAPMVRAILDGSKTQTRRPIKHDVRGPDVNGTFDWYDGERWVGAHKGNGHNAHFGTRVVPDNALRLCPYGVPGDRLWVRETFYLDTMPDGRLPKSKPADADGNLYYRADGECCDQIPECSCAEVGKPKWRPSIFLPRWASRIDLAITSVRVERVNDISEADARAEGFPCADDFAHEWALIYGEAFRAWVWVVDFKRVRP